MLCFPGHLYEKAIFQLSNLVVVNFLWGQTPEVLVEAVNCFWKLTLWWLVFVLFQFCGYLKVMDEDLLWSFGKYDSWRGWHERKMREKENHKFTKQALYRDPNCSHIILFFTLWASFLCPIMEALIGLNTMTCPFHPASQLHKLAAEFGISYNSVFIHFFVSTFWYDVSSVHG